MQKQRIIYNGVRRNLMLATSIAFTAGLVYGGGMLEPSMNSLILPSASAAVTGFPRPVPPLENIDLERKASVTIKIPDSSSGTNAGLPGYEVTVILLKTDPINTSEGYAKASKLTVEQAKKLEELRHYSGVTDAKGEANFSELVPGAYLVTTKSPKPGDRKPQEEVLIAPIIGENGEWDYSFTAVMKFKNNPKPGPTLPPWVPPVTQTTPPPTKDEQPPASDNPASKQNKKREALPLTGASVVGLIVISLSLIAGGFSLLVSRKNGENSTY
ncbi:anchor protein [Corynebacterium pseudotuberculosis]|uniref:anchor protein n=1 Tax=Corynebacterium pseudotuberculosis TaxID=1719 RepID=UPI00021AAF5F|nr:anchor protein [Corynebacterium pseudotuberculosis]AEK93191.1 Gram-positive anchor [Corynebacterium pseudotuberculosis PAT10]